MKQPMQVLTSSKTNEWYTPPEIIGLVSMVLGGIELDPASCKMANTWIRAERIYTIEDDGLSYPWVADTLFMNPPYGKIGNRSAQDVWMEYLISQLPTIGACIALTKTTPGYHWWANLFRGHWPGVMCITEKRISFVSSDGERRGMAKAASSFWYYGPRQTEFKTKFYLLGRVLQREHW